MSSGFVEPVSVLLSASEVDSSTGSVVSEGVGGGGGSFDFELAAGGFVTGSGVCAGHISQITSDKSKLDRKILVVLPKPFNSLDLAIVGTPND